MCHRKSWGVIIQSGPIVFLIGPAALPMKGRSTADGRSDDCLLDGSYNT